MATATNERELTKAREAILRLIAEKKKAAASK